MAKDPDLISDEDFLPNSEPVSAPTSVDPLAGAAAGGTQTTRPAAPKELTVLQALAEDYKKAKEAAGPIGLDENTLEWAGYKRPGAGSLGPLQSVANIPGAAADALYSANQVSGLINDLGIRQLDRYGSVNMPDFVSKTLGLPGVFEPGQAVGAAQEAFPLAGLESGVNFLPNLGRRDISPDVAQEHADAVAKMVNDARAQGRPVSWEEINKYVTDQGYAPYSDEVASVLQEAEKKFAPSYRTPEEELLLQEAVQKTAADLNIPEDKISKAARESDFQSSVRATLREEGLDPSIVDKQTNPKFIQGANDVEGGGAAIAPDPSNPTPVPVEQPDVVTRVTEALRGAGKAREEQTKLYKEERNKRIAAVRAAQQPGKGEESLRDALSALKGELPKADFEAVGPMFSQADIDELHNIVISTETLTPLGKVSAQKGLFNLMQGKVPAPKELEYLSKAFPADFIKTALSKRSTLSKNYDTFKEVWNLPKSLMASADLSAPLRQGIGLAHRKEYWQATADMFGFADPVYGKKRFDQLSEYIETHPNYALAEESGLSLTNISGRGPNEDAFSSHLGEKIPVISHIVKGSERAYVGFLDKLRFDTFNSMIDEASKAGLDPADVGKSVARYINVMTGRGGLGKLESVSEELNLALFSPRLISSRLQILTAPAQAVFGKGFIADLPPALRKEAAKSYASIIGQYGIAAGAATLAGMTIEDNPLSSDFGKIRDGNTRVDMGAGLAQYITAGARAVMRESKSIKSGETRDLTKRGDTPLDSDLKFLFNKLSPTMSLIIDQQRGTNAVGEEFTWGKAILDRMVPMGIPDIIDTLKEHPNQKGALYAVLGLLGAGLQNFDAEGSSKAELISDEDFLGSSEPVDEAIDPSLEPSGEEEDLISDEGFLKDSTLVKSSANELASTILKDTLGLHVTDEGVRDPEDQKRYFATSKGVAKPGTSPHEYAKAIDIRVPKGVPPSRITKTLEGQGFKGVRIITKKHGTAPHWHIQWDGIEDVE